MNTDVITTVHQNEVIIEVKLTNHGDESANEIKVAANLPSGEKWSTPIAKLEPGIEKILTFRLSKTKGFLRKIVPLIIYYKNKMGQSFSAVSYAIINFSQSEPPTVFAKIEHIQVARQKTLTVTAKCIDNRQSHRVKIKIIVPKELSISPAIQELLIPVYGETHARFKLMNLYAIPNSTYFVLGVLSEKRKQGVYEEIFSGDISIVTPNSITKVLSERTAIWVLVALIFCYVLYQFVSKKKM